MKRSSGLLFGSLRPSSRVDTTFLLCTTTTCVSFASGVHCVHDDADMAAAAAVVMVMEGGWGRGNTVNRYGGHPNWNREKSGQGFAER